MTRFTWLIALLASIYYSASVAAQTHNGFDLSDTLIPAAEILPGGPPRDGIPAIDNPQFVAATEATFLTAEERLLGVVRNGVAKAYPISILNWHEIVNDRFGEEAIAITFCPLCGTGMSFRATIDGQDHSFGVSGLLYKSDVLLYDRNTESLWSQLDRRAVSGQYKGRRLEMVATAHTTWADWAVRHPDTLVLSTDTGYRRDYNRNPYLGYADSEQTLFPVGPIDRRYHPKELVVGLEMGETFKAYPFTELVRAATPRFSDEVAGQSLTVEYYPSHRSARVLDSAGQEIPTVIAFWFAWTAFHPQTEVYQAKQ